MILNGPILISIFLAVPGLVLGLAALVCYGRQIRTRAATGSVVEGEGAYLVFLLLLTAFGLRVLAWPITYIALESAVPQVPGAMCIFGVTRLCPLWANLLQVVRPALILCLGGWLALRLAHSSFERRNPGRQRRRSAGEQVLFLFSVVLLIADCVLELIVFLSLRPEQPVYCCGSVYDLPDRFSSLIPGSLLGAQYANLILPLLTLCGLSCAAVCLAAGCAVLKGVGTSDGRRSMRIAMSAVPPLLLLSLVAVAFFAAMEVITPRLTGLPYHHCLYCLLGKTASGPMMAVALALAVACGVWGSLLQGGPSRRSGGLLLVIGGLSVLAFLGICHGALALSGSGGDLGNCPTCDDHLYDTVYLVEVVTGTGEQCLFCSVVCALEDLRSPGVKGTSFLVTVRDEFTGQRIDSGAAFFVEAAADIEGLPSGNRWHSYQYLENAHIMAFELDGNVLPDPFGTHPSGP